MLEAWLTGKIEGIPDVLMPAAHALKEARIELEDLRGTISEVECRLSLGGAAPVGFHLVHIAGSLDRLFTYARGEQLSEQQFAFLKNEKDAAEAWSVDNLFSTALDRIDDCLDALRNTPADKVFEPREVGRGRLPSNVLGLLFHAGEHTTMHVGQIRTTLKILRGL